MNGSAGSLGKCLVTGGRGFLGSRLLSLLQQEGHQVRVVLREPATLPGSPEVCFGSLGQSGRNFPYREALAGIDTVFHLAATAHTHAVASQYRSDCDASLELARQAHLQGVRRFVFVSSTKAMADPGSIKRDESWVDWPTDSYGYWKRTAEQRLLDEIAVPHLAIVRPCLIYGVGVKGNLRKMINAVHRGYFPPLPETGGERSMVDVSDVARALLFTAVHNDANRNPLIVTDGHAYTAYGIYCDIRKALGLSPVPPFTIPLPVFKLSGLVGDMARNIWSGCPVSSEAIDRLTGAAAFSSERLCNLGWMAAKNFHDELPAIVKACLEDRGS